MPRHSMCHRRLMYSISIPPRPAVDFGCYVMNLFTFPTLTLAELVAAWSRELLLIQRRISCHLQNFFLPSFRFSRANNGIDFRRSASAVCYGAMTRSLTYRFKVLVGCCTQLFLTFPFSHPLLPAADRELLFVLSKLGKASN